MSNEIYSDNVTGAGTENSEGLVSGRRLVCKQADLGRQFDSINPEQNN